MSMEKFAEYLAVKRLSIPTIKRYLSYYKLFDKGLDYNEFNQSYINSFMLKHTSNIVPAFLNNLFEFLNITHVKVPKISGRKKVKKRRVISDKEIFVIRKWLYSNKDIKYLLCFDILYTGGLRRSEVLNIKSEDFDISKWAEDTNKACKLLIHGKGNRERYIPIPPKLMERIIKYIDRRNFKADEKIFDFSSITFWEHFKQAVKQTMDYNYTIHDLRRGRATNWLKDNVNLIGVRNRLGHQSVSTTQLYINLDEEEEFDKWAKENQRD